MFKFLTLGFLLGLNHALDSDHIAAVGTIVSETKNLKKSSKIGAAWGMGHTFTLLIAGLLLMGLKISISETLASTFEIGIGILLIGLGLNVYRKIKNDKIHIHKHAHDGIEHTHLHGHKKSPSHIHKHHKKSFAIGMIHGLAGSAGIMLILLGTIDNMSEGILTILFFGIGTIFGMSIISTLIGIPFLLTSKLNRWNKGVKFMAGTLSILIGIQILI